MTPSVESEGADAVSREGAHGTTATARILAAVAGCTCLVVALLALAAAPAGAATTHDLLSQITKIPTEGPKHEPVALPGNLATVPEMAVDSGRLYIAEFIEGGSHRVDAFDATSGAFVVQFPEDPSLSALGQLGLGVGQAAGHVYLGAIFEGEYVVGVFDTTGAPVGTWTGLGAQGVVGVVADNSTSVGDFAKGDVLVANRGEGTVNVLEPVEGGKKANKIAQLAGPEGPFQFPGEHEAMAMNPANGDLLVEDGNAVDVFAPKPTALEGYEFLFRITGVNGRPFSQVTGLAVDSNGDIYVAEDKGPPEEFVYQFDSTGKSVGRVAGTAAGGFHRLASVTVEPETHHLFVGDFTPETQTGVVDLFGPSVVIPDVATLPVTSFQIEPATHTWAASLTGTVNPDNAGEASCEFEYGTSASYGQRVKCKGTIANTNAVVEVQSPPVTGLLPDTTYHYRLDATNDSGVHVNTGECPEDCAEFTTPGAGVHSESVAEVKSSSATLQASVDPNNAPTSIYFQYGKTTAYEEPPLPAPPGVAIGSGKGDVEVPPQHLQELAPGTLYHYRVIALSATTGKPESFPGPDHTFTTQSPGEAALPDGRAWELVSPPDKHGANVPTFTEAGDDFFQASAAGDAIAWPATGPIEPRPQGASASGEQVLSTRAAGAWFSLDLETSYSSALGLHLRRAYPFFSEDLSRAVLQPYGAFNPSLSPQASEITPYVRTSFLGDPSRGCTESCFRPLVTGCPAEGKPCPPPVKEIEDVPPGTIFAPEGATSCTETDCGPGFLDATPDLSHVLLASEVALTATPIPGVDVEEVYEWANGKLALVTRLPCSPAPCQGQPAFRPLLGFENGQSPVHPISSDGSRVFWEQLGGALYMRDMAREETIEIGPTPFEGASADGSRVFFAGMECEVQLGTSGGLECPIVAKAEQGRQMLASSEDGSWVYYEKNGSLYVRHAGTTKLIAAEVSGLGPVQPAQAIDHHWRVSPNGRWFAFMSNSPLTGYDNRDAVSGVADEEVFLYDAASERLACASCNPTGARPHGASFPAPVVAGWPGGTVVAASVPGWTPFSPGVALHQPRYLSNEGRLFFDSSDALVPKDVNHQQDVYQFEPEGVPAGAHPCGRGSSSGSVAYVPSAGGCLGLISSGESSEETTFLDASETGGDVFFEMNGRFSALDLDGSMSIFDAHECTPGSPCIPQSAAVPPQCETEASCKASPSPQPAIFGASGSATFSGPGNLVPSGGGAPPHRSEARAQKLARALKACRRLRSPRRRQVCERHARKLYRAAKTTRAGRARRRTR